MQWKVGFDCATKSFAFSIGRVDFEAARAGLRRQAEAAAELLKRAAAGDATAAAAVKTIAADLEVKTRFIVIADGGFVDLFPGRNDDSINPVERIKAVVAYVAARVRPAIERIVGREPCGIVIEFQMGHNAKSRVVQDALVAIFAEYPIEIVSPALKNTIHVDSGGRYANFIETRMTTYAANKAHAKYNFGRLEQLFGSGVAATSAAERGHIADSFMQIVGSASRRAGQ